MNADLKVLTAAADLWELVGYAAAGLVLVGVIIESWELIVAFRQRKFREKVVECIGVLILVTGLTIEILAQVQSNNRTGLIIGYLNAQGERERLERTKLEAIIAPRSLTVDQQRAIGRSLRALFAGRRVVVTTYALDLESAVLALQVMDALADANIEPINRTAAIMPLGGFAVGIFVSGKDENLVMALRTALIERGKLAVAPSDVKASGSLSMQAGPAPGDDEAGATVLIAVKPLPIRRPQ